MSEAQVEIKEGIGKLLAAGRSLWLAGLGAVAEAEEEGRELFDRLVERGRPLEERQKKAAEAVTVAPSARPASSANWCRTRWPMRAAACSSG